MQDYDDIPYQSLSFADTHPERLAVLGRLFGLSPADTNHCRVLELGCGQGGNLLPMACSLPGSEFVGIELSPSQANTGLTNIAQLGLNNIHIHQGDILHLSGELGQFDYIIAHGVFSWVEAPVRDKMLEMTRLLLRNDGLAYISYNVNPGWRLRGVLRDMLLYSVRDIEQPRQRLKRAQELLPEISASLAGVETPLAQYLREQVGRLGQEDPSYFYHEYLETVNQPMLFSEFIQQAGQHGLQYVCDTELYTMFASSLGDQAAPFIDRFEDLMEQEQYMDFLRGRGFRQSILCHDAVNPDYDIDVSLLEQFAVYADVQPQQKNRKRGPRTFLTAAGERFTAEQPLTAAVLTNLGNSYPDAVSLPELFERAKEHISSADLLAQKASCLGELFNLYANGVIGLNTCARRSAVPNADKPLVSGLARLQASQGDAVTTMWHGNLSVDRFAARFIQCMDGIQGLDEIVSNLVEEVSNGDLPVFDESASGNVYPVQSLPSIRDLVTANCQRLLALFIRHGLFEAEAVYQQGHAA